VVDNIKEGHASGGGGIGVDSSHVFGALDLGTNNCRLLVAKKARIGFRVIDSFSRIVRLGEGMARGNELSEKAIDRTIEALKICADKIARRNVTHMRNVATAACRHAINHESFITRVRLDTGLKFDIITAEEEARLAVSGCVTLFADDAEYGLVFDIGGGSTELIWVAVNDDGTLTTLDWISLPCGVVTLAETHGGQSVSQESYERMIAEVEVLLEDFEAENNLRSVMARASVQVIGTSGTVTTLAGVHLDLARYDRRRVDGLWMDSCDLTRISQEIVEMSYDEKVAQPCIGIERADLVVAGCAIYEAIANKWPSERLRVADRGLREGILLDLMREADGAYASHRPQ